MVVRPRAPVSGLPGVRRLRGRGAGPECRAVPVPVRVRAFDVVAVDASPAPILVAGTSYERARGHKTAARHVPRPPHCQRLGR